MNKIYFKIIAIVVCGIMLTSCSSKYHFVTQGLPNTDSSYVVTTNGEHIDAAEIDVRPKGVTVDGKSFPLDRVSSIRSKKMYFAVKDGKIYLGQIYGKITVLYQVSYIHTYNTVYAGPGRAPTSSSSTTVDKTYYLQKLGHPEIDRFNRGTFFDYISGNDEAVRMAKSSYIWHYTSYATFAGGVAAMAYTVKSLNAENPFGSIAKPLAFVGVAVVAHSVVSSISDNKLRKAIMIYNTAEDN